MEDKEFPWTDELAKEFATVATKGAYGSYRGCKTIESKLEKFKQINLKNRASATFFDAKTNTSKIIWFENEAPTLKELQDAVGGYIEPVYIGKEVMLLDEEGLLKDLPVNHIASRYAQAHGGLNEVQKFVGNALVMDKNLLQ
jgi:hypothetical protein